MHQPPPVVEALKFVGNCQHFGVRPLRVGDVTDRTANYTVLWWVGKEAGEIAAGTGE